MNTSENSSTTKSIPDAIDKFNDALVRRDFDKFGATMTEDCIFEDTDPRPDGKRYVGRDAIVNFFKEMAEISPDSTFDVEEVIVCGDRCVVLWNHRWIRDGVKGNNRGIDVFRVREGKVAEKLAYTKNG